MAAEYKPAQDFRKKDMVAGQPRSQTAAVAPADIVAKMHHVVNNKPIRKPGERGKALGCVPAKSSTSAQAHFKKYFQLCGSSKLEKFRIASAVQGLSIRMAALAVSSNEQQRRNGRPVHPSAPGPQVGYLFLQDSSAAELSSTLRLSTTGDLSVRLCTCNEDIAGISHDVCTLLLHHGATRNGKRGAAVAAGSKSSSRFDNIKRAVLATVNDVLKRFLKINAQASVMPERKSNYDFRLCGALVLTMAIPCMTLHVVALCGDYDIDSLCQIIDAGGSEGNTCTLQIMSSREDVEQVQQSIDNQARRRWCADERQSTNGDDAASRHDTVSMPSDDEVGMDSPW